MLIILDNINTDKCGQFGKTLGTAMSW